MRGNFVLAYSKAFQLHQCACLRKRAAWRLDANEIHARRACLDYILMWCFHPNLFGILAARAYVFSCKLVSGGEPSNSRRKKIY